MKLNNKGFAISSILYIILILAITLIVLSLTMLNSRYLVIDKLKNKVLENIYTDSYNNIIKTLKQEIITYASTNNIEKESIKISEMQTSILSTTLEKNKLTEKYLTVVLNGENYDVYLGNAKTINDISQNINIIDILDYKIKGNSYQKTYTGKNIFDKNKLSNGEITTYDGKEVYKYIDNDTNFIYTDEFESGKQYTLTLKTYRDDVINDKISIYFNYTDGTTSYVDIAPGEKTSATSKGGKTLQSISGYNNSNKTVYIDLSTIQLEKSASATDYEPYVGGIASPNPSYPQEIKSVGNLVTDSNDEYYGKYKIKIKSTTPTDNKETVIILDAPLRSIDTYYDIIDYSAQNLVRSVNEYIITGSEGNSSGKSWKYSGGYGMEIRSNVLNTTTTVPTKQIAMSNYYTYMNSNNNKLDHIRLTSNFDTYGYIAINDLNYQGEDTVDSFVLYLKDLYDSGVPIRVIYPVYSDRNTISLELPKINTFEGNQTISIDTDIKPSSVEFTVIQKIKQL